MNDVYTTPIKASVQAAGYLREDFRNLDHEEPVLEQYKINVEDQIRFGRWK